MLFQAGTITGDVPLERHAVHAYRGLGMAVAADEGALEALAALAPVEAVQPLHPSFARSHHLVRALDLTTLLVAANHDPDAPPEARLLGPPPPLLPVVNLSLGPTSAVHPVDHGDAVQMATWSLSRHCLVVAAAGNSGDLHTRESLSAWAQVPWVVAVGATDDEDGTELWPRSSRGTADDPGSGPDLVAHGRSGLDPSVVGTSFAAPRVAFAATVAGAAVGQLRHAVQQAAHSAGPGWPEPEPVRLLGITFVDRFTTDPWYVGPARIPTAQLPPLDLTPAAGELARHLAGQHPGAEVRAGSAAVARLLAGAARPVPGRDRHEVGAGFVGDDLLARHLATLPAASWAALLGHAGLVPRLPPALARAPLFDEAQAHLLTEVVRATQPIVLCDHRSGEVRLRPDQPVPTDPAAQTAPTEE